MPVSVHKLQGRPISPEVSARFDKRRLHEHWREVAEVFNEACEQVGLPLRLRWEHLISDEMFDRLIEESVLGESLQNFLEARAAGKPVKGVMHDNQIRTMVEAFQRINEEPRRSVLVLGSMMCGKTGTASGMNLIGPMFYLLTGKKYYPIQLLPVRKATHDQTQGESRMWLALYQELIIESTETQKLISVRQFRSQAPRLREHCDASGNITLKRYRARVMRGPLRAHVEKIGKRFNGDIHDALMRRRSRRNVTPVRELCLDADADGFVIVLIIDEPHWGSHKGGIQDQMLDTLKTLATEEMRTGNDHILICFDATPYQIANASGFAVVRHRLSPDYCGPNCWGGAPLDPTVRTKDVLLNTLDEFAVERNILDFAMISRKAYADLPGYQKWLNGWNKNRLVPLTLSHAQYCARMEKALRDGLHHLLLPPTAHVRTRGICLRLLKSNESSKRLISKLKLDARIKVIYYMSEAGQDSVDETIRREAPSGPYLVVVTGAARMADFFPQHCTHFLDFTDFVSNQVSLLQGSYGRACGFGEPRWVVMGERSIRAIRAYLESMGQAGLPPGKQASVPATGRQGAPFINVRINRETISGDPIAMGAFRAVQQTIVDRLPFGDGETLTHIRRNLSELFDGGYVPFWAIFNEEMLRYFETNSKALLPDCDEPPRFLRKGVSQHTATGEIRVAMHPDPMMSDQGYGKVGLRNLEAFLRSESTSANMRSKGKFFNRTANTGRGGGVIEGGAQPQLWLLPDRKHRRWRLEEIVVRLEHAVRGRRLFEHILAAEGDTYLDFHSPEQKMEVTSRRHLGRRRPVAA